MTPERWEKVGELFNAALELDGPERSRFLAEACAGDQELRVEVESLLTAGVAAGNFISEPVLIGFKAGIAVVIVIDQLPKILGVHFAKGSFLHNVQGIAHELPHVSFATVVVGGVAMIGLATPAYAVLALYLGVLFGWESVRTWLENERGGTGTEIDLEEEAGA